MSLPPLIIPRSLRRGFTLVELLASMSVLTLLLLMVVQMINATVAVTAAGGHHLDADTQARLVLDRMAVDFGQIVKRADVDYYFQKNGSGSPGGAADDQLAFYSETSGYYPPGITGPVPKSNASLVGYRIYQRQLQRLDKALVWNGVTSSTAGASGLSSVPRGMTFLPQTLAAAWPDVPGNGNDADYHTIGEQIFRLEVCYLVRNAATSAAFSDLPYVGAPAVPVPYNGLRDVSAVVVTFAVLDDTSRLLVSTADLDAAAAKLDDSKSAGSAANGTAATPPAQRWLAHLNHGDLVRSGGSPGLPAVTAAQVRVYERCFYLGNSQ